jgi:hypothetical protein
LIESAQVVISEHKMPGLFDGIDMFGIQIPPGSLYHKTNGFFLASILASLCALSNAESRVKSRLAGEIKVETED